jgi:Ca2+-binding RTX toxin-like protein
VVSSNGHNIFGSDVQGAVIGDLQGIAPSLLFASIDPATGGGQLNAAGIVPLRNSVTNPALSGGDPLAALPTDQIGKTRPLPAGSLPDIGAAERNQALSTTASPNNDVLTGTDAANTILAKAGADLIRGLAGNDTLRGEAGSDVLDGGTGNDLPDGGDGIDLARIGGSTAVAIDLVAGTAKRGAETDTLTSIQGAIGSSAADTFTGDGGPNWFQGGGGRDVATGGAARDLYDFDRVQDSLPGATNRDVIGDLAPQSDRIDLTGIDADATRAGNQAFRFVGADPLTGPGQLGFRVSGGNTIVRGSTDGDTAPELEIQLTALTGIGGYVFYL